MESSTANISKKSDVFAYIQFMHRYILFDNLNTLNKKRFTLTPHQIKQPLS